MYFIEKEYLSLQCSNSAAIIKIYKLCQKTVRKKLTMSMKLQQ